MRVLVAGATGVVGRTAVALLQREGHHVVGLARSRDRASVVDAELVVADALDRAALADVVRRAGPDVVVNLLTAIPAQLQPRRFASQMAPTNRLRAEGTANLLAAADGARFVTESVAFLYRPGPSTPVDEDHPLWSDGPRALHEVLGALRRAESLTLGSGGTVLRLGHLYGPATHLAPDGSFASVVRAGRVPMVGGGRSVFSFTHTDDAARAVVAAVRSGTSGTYNVVDDDPAPVGVWLPELARLLGAPPPRKAPAWLAGLLGGAWGRAYLTSLVGADNARARAELGWTPSRPSWRTGFAEMVGGPGGRASSAADPADSR